MPLQFPFVVIEPNENIDKVYAYKTNREKQETATLQLLAAYDLEA